MALLAVSNGSERKREMRFLLTSSLTSLQKTAFLSHLYIKTIILPRQARDKHRENTQKKMPFSAPAVAFFALV
jgi:hypothetical protein